MKRYLLSKLIILVLFILGVQKTQAQNNWDGDSALGNFSTFIDSYKNWVGDTFPAAWNSTTDLSFVLRNNPSQTTMYLDYGTWKDCRNITYQASYLAGLPFDADGPLYNENGLNFYGKIENYSPNFTHTFNTIPVHGKNATQIELNPINGGLTFNRPILNGGNVPYRVYGPNGKKLTINTTGYPAGNGSVSFNIEQYSIVEMDYNNPASLSGGYFVKEGELWINSLAVLQSGIQVGNGNANFAKLYISHASTPTTVANAITVPTNSPNVTIGALNTSNLHTYSGTINLNNNDVNFDVVSAGGSLNFTNTISGTGGLRKISPGLVRLSGSNTYTGKTVVNQGTLQYGTANAIADASNVTLNGGKFSTGATIGYSDIVGTLELTDNSIIELGTGNNILAFAASNLVAWTPAKILTITGWTNDCAGAKVFVGTNNTGLTATQLAQITFSGYAPGASISPIGELIPGNIVLTATSGTLLQANYATLKAAFDAINTTGTHTGDIAISVLNDTNEGTATAALNQVVGVTSVSIQPGGCGPRVISGATTAGNPMVDFNGADNVMVDGLNTGGNSLTFTNTTGSAVSGTCTIRFQVDAIDNTITKCSILGSATMASGTYGGNICFGVASGTGVGNDNNTISYCNIGPAGANLPSKGIYFSGTPGRENSGNTIDNNNIYDFFSATVSSAGIDAPFIGTNTIAITNNRFYQTATRTQTTASTHSGVRIANASGNGFDISGNTFGYGASNGTGTYNFVGIASSFFYPINISVASASIQGNTFAGISHNTSTAAFSALNMFSAINVTAGNVNIGNVAGNTIGLATAPITFNATAGLGGTINAINMTGTGAVSIENNTIQSITTTGVAGAAYNFTGINIAGSAVYTVINNTIGNTLASDSINIGSLGVSTVGSSFTGINALGTGVAVNIGTMGNPNTIQNITMNAAATNNFTGIFLSGSNSTSNINYNNVNGIRFASANPTGSTCIGINNTTPVSVAAIITNNNLGNATTNFVSYAAGCSGVLIGIRNFSGSASPAPVTISNNDIQGISHTGVTSSAHTYIYNLGGNLGLDINNNTFTNLNVNTTGTVIFISNSCNTAAASIKNVNNNNIITGYVRTGTTGTVNVFIDSSASVTNAITNNQNNNFSNITVAGSTTMTGWVNTDGGQPTKNISSNTFNNWTLGSGAVTVMNISNFGGVSSVSSNTISNVSTTGSITGLNIGTLGSSSTLTASSNTITNLTSSGSGSIIGITNSQPATTLINNTNSNTITGLSSATGSVVGITNSSASPTKTISNNTISSLSNTGNLVTAINSSNGSSVAIATNTISSISSTSVTATSIVSAISVTGGSTIAITNNPISTLSSANNGSFRGIYVSPLGATSNTISGNTINGMTSISTGASFSVRGIEVQGTNNATISANTISNITSPTTNVVLGAGTPIVGLYYGSSGTASTITGNTIFSINATATTAINVSAAAIATGSTTAGGTITKNRIYGLTNTTNGTLVGTTNYTIGFLPNGGNWTVANNMISITNNNTVKAVGVYDTGATGVRKYYYNSIYIGGSHAGSQASIAFQFNNAAGTGEIKNNIFVMARTSGGKNYAIANTSGSFSNITTNYNVLNGTVASTIGLSNATDTSFAAWKTASGGDTNSYTAAVVSFVNTAIADLHIVAGCTDIESGGTPVAITDDYDTAARNATTPDIGADEFTGTRPADITLTPDTPICEGNSTILTATSTDLTYVYTWSPAAGLSATTGASVTASPIVTTTYTVTGTAPSSCVKTKDVTITVNPLPAAITVSPSTANICPNVIQTFTASPYVGSVTVGTPTGNSAAAQTPYSQGISTESRIQYLITKAELNAGGMAGGNIVSLSFNVTTAGTYQMPSYVVTMANTTATALTSTFLTTGFTTVYSGTNILPVFGINTHTFSVPFAWDGISNIVININHTGSGIGSNPFSVVPVSTTPTICTVTRNGSGSFASLTGTPQADRPNIIFGFENPITWSPTANLFIDAAAMTAYNPATHLNQPTIYAKVPAPVVYTATLTTVGTGCTRTSTGTITMNSSVWNGSGWLPSTPTGNTSLTFTGNYTSSGNLSGCSCSVTGGDVIFNDPDALILSGGLTVASPGTLKFNNNASLVQTDDSSINSGFVNIERTTQKMYRYDFTYWGTPVTLASNFTLGTGVNSLSPATLSDKYFSWIPTVASAGGNWANESIATVMDPIKGYCVRAPQTWPISPLPATKLVYTTNFIGTPNNGIISSPIYHGTLALVLNDDKYNLIGNPYPSALDAQAFLTDPLNTPIIDGTIYFWTHNSPIAAGPSPFYGTFALNYNNNDYAAWNSSGAVGFRDIQAGTGGLIPSGFIGTGQGFFTKSKGTAASGLPVTFKNSMRVVGNNNQFFKNSISTEDKQLRSENTSAEKSRIWLDLISNSGKFSQILVGYLADATLGWDSFYDGVPIDESGMLLYSIIPDRKLVIQGRPLPFEEEDQVALGFKSTAQDIYTFGLDAVDGLFDNQNIYIEDRDLNIVHDLKESPYIFTAAAGTFNDRFVLRYTDAALGNETFNTNANVVAFIYNHELNIKSTKNITHIDLFDISGKLIKTYANENAIEFKTKFNFAQGVYLVKIKLDNGIEVTKKIVH